MNWKLVLACVIFAGITCGVCAADPMTFKEISLLIRNGEQQQYILQNATQRKLLAPLTHQEELDLVAAGATPALIAALRSPSLLATPETAAAYKARMQSRQAEAAADSVAAPSVPVPAVPMRRVGVDHFTEDLKAAQNAPAATVQFSDAFSMAQLDKAVAKAKEERKPLGFIMTWGKLFNLRVSNRSRGSTAAFVHFQQAFSRSLVLVYVRHETELDQVPPAVKRGFFGPDEGGFSPNMAVTDATASELIVEIPMGGGNSTGAERDEVFRAGAARIDEWLAGHPTAIAMPHSPK